MFGNILGRIAYVPAVAELLMSFFSTNGENGNSILAQVRIPKKYVGMAYVHLFKDWLVGDYHPGYVDIDIDIPHSEQRRYQDEYDDMDIEDVFETHKYGYGEDPVLCVGLLRELAFVGNRRMETIIATMPNRETIITPTDTAVVLCSAAFALRNSAICAPITDGSGSERIGGGNGRVYGTKQTTSDFQTFAMRDLEAKKFGQVDDTN